MYSFHATRLEARPGRALLLSCTRSRWHVVDRSRAVLGGTVRRALERVAARQLIDLDLEAGVHRDVRRILVLVAAARVAAIRNRPAGITEANPYARVLVAALQPELDLQHEVIERASSVVAQPEIAAWLDQDRAVHQVEAPAAGDVPGGKGGCRPVEEHEGSALRGRGAARRQSYPPKVKSARSPVPGFISPCSCPPWISARWPGRSVRTSRERSRPDCLHQSPVTMYP